MLHLAISFGFWLTVYMLLFNLISRLTRLLFLTKKTFEQVVIPDQNQETVIQND